MIAELVISDNATKLLETGSKGNMLLIIKNFGVGKCVMLLLPFLYLKK